MTQTEVSKKGSELAMKWLGLKAETLSGSDAFEITGYGEFYEWLIKQGYIITREDHLEQLADAEHDAVEDALYDDSIQRA